MAYTIVSMAAAGPQHARVVYTEDGGPEQEYTFALADLRRRNLRMEFAEAFPLWVNFSLAQAGQNARGLTRAQFAEFCEGKTILATPAPNKAAAEDAKLGG